MQEKICIMIADDFQLLREDIYDLLEKQKDMIVVGSAGSGKEIVELSRAKKADIILMDIEMEKSDAGILATEVILREQPDVKVIFLTAHETNEIIVTAMGAGAVDYIVKGCHDEEILLHIRNAYLGNPIMNAKVQQTIMQEYMRLQKSEKSLLFFINNISKLTTAENELVRLILKGLKVNEIAKVRCVEAVTIKTQIKGILRKFGCSRTKEIVKIINDLNINHLFQ